MLVATTPAAAQEFGADTVILTDANASLGVLGLTVEQTVGKTIYDVDGQELGSVNRVLGDDQDTPTALAIETSAGIVILDLANTELINNRITTALSADEFSALPKWEQ
ncbi:hypothetical protein VW35_01895 [Devosia soli]|uniref:PRC-barrel domain-containing protein n=1 Tax=Devosia soli TaxID=361041 RepID=A0A0F5LEY8_9HYPH|nr:hypothetical protein VW35_01895 [Devosia soli]